MRHWKLCHLTEASLNLLSQHQMSSLLLILFLCYLQCCHTLGCLESVPCRNSSCEVQRSCRSWLDAGGRAGIRYRNVTCAADLSCECQAVYYSRDAVRQRVFCGEGQLILCTDSAYNLTCPPGTLLKIWYAYYGRSVSNVCTSLPEPRGPKTSVGNASLDAADNATDATAVAGSYLLTNAQPNLQSVCVTPVLTQAIMQCDRRRHCWLEPDRMLAGVQECRDVAPYLQLDFACLGLSDSNTSAEQELFFRWGMIAIGALFPTSLLALLVTVQLRKKRHDAYKMNSMHLPLTSHENPET